MWPLRINVIMVTNQGYYSDKRSASKKRLSIGTPGCSEKDEIISPRFLFSLVCALNWFPYKTKYLKQNKIKSKNFPGNNVSCFIRALEKLIGVFFFNWKALLNCAYAILLTESIHCVLLLPHILLKLTNDLNICLLDQINNLKIWQIC